VLLHDVKVVEQPFAGRTNVGLASGRSNQPCVGVAEDSPGTVKPCQQAGTPPPAGGKALVSGNDACAFGQAFGA
jgi:hypothetical protein